MISQSIKIESASKPADLQAIIQFDKQKFSKSSYFGLIKEEKPSHFSYYNINRVGFRDGEVIIAKSQSEKVIARLSIGVKNIYLQQQNTKVGYIFDIQLLEPHQISQILNQKITIQDLKEIFSTLLEQSITIIKNKYKIQLIYTPQKHIIHEELEEKDLETPQQAIQYVIQKQLNFHSSSERAISICNIEASQSFQDQIDWNKKLKNGTNAFYKFQQERTKILEWTEKAQYDSKTDFFLQDFRTEFLGNENYKGCFCMITGDQESVAGIHVFEEQKKFEGTYQRYFVAPEIIAGDYFQVYVNILLGMVLIFFMLSLIEIGTSIYLAVALIFIMFAYFQRKIDVKIREILANKRPFLRVAMPFYFGDKEIEEEMFTILITNLVQEKIFSSHLNIRANLSAEDQYFKHFQNTNYFVDVGIRPTYQIKYLDPQLEESFTPEKTAQIQSFYDPRDI